MIALRERPIDWRYTSKPHPLKRGLVFHMGGWMAGSVIARDGDGMPGRVKNHGTLTNMDPATDWVWDSTLGRWVNNYANASAKYIQTSSLTALVGTGAFSFSLWVYRPSGTSERHILGWTEDAGNRQVYWYNGNLYFYRSGGPSLYKAVSLAGWHHVVGVDDRSTRSLYIDGALVDGPDAVTTILDPGTLRIGAYGASTAYCWDGYIADSLIYARAISPSEIQQLADPSNVMLSGLILPPARRLWPVAVSGDTTNKKLAHHGGMMAM